ncbi:hypothetical protein DsansV1_C11g0112361 [Dioscorea sansibarensis]
MRPREPIEEISEHKNEERVSLVPEQENGPIRISYGSFMVVIYGCKLWIEELAGMLMPLIMSIKVRQKDLRTGLTLVSQDDQTKDYIGRTHACKKGRKH